MSTEQPEAPAIPRLVTQEELAGYFKRLRFTDPRDAAANAFAEIQAHREPAPDPLIMPDGEFQATRTVAEALRLASGPPATEHGEAVTAVRRGLDLAAPFAGDDPRIIAAARTALRVLGGEETDAGPGEAIVETLEAVPAGAALDREHVQDLIASALDESVGRCARCKVCDSQINAVMHAIWPLLEGAGYWHKRWTAALERADEDGMQAISQHVRIGELERRAEAAEAKLDAIGDEIEAGWPGLRPSTRLGSGTAVQRIRAITDTKGDADRG